MNKKNKIVITVVLLLFIFATMFIYLNNIKSTLAKGPSLVISNKTNHSIEHLKVKYTTSSKEIEIPPIKPNENYKYIISTEADDSINLIYTDKSGNNQKKLVASYITKGITNTFKVDVESNDNSDIIVNTNK